MKQDRTVNRLPSFGVLLAACLAPVTLIFPPLSMAQPSHETAPGYVLINRGDTGSEILRKAASVVPTPRQLLWERREMSAFVHFGINTFADQEWGSGREDPRMFNPTDFDARQWVRVLKDAGMKELILTAKHHDGFCLWPSRFTAHSVRSSPWRHGNGDVVAEVASACRSAGMAFGIYLSPWDRHEPVYGNSPRYNEYFLNQLRELLTGYGEIAEVWFDGACGEGPNGKRQEYDWASYYALVRELQPNAVIAVMGPDVRWVGTETGEGRLTEWSVLPDTSGVRDTTAREDVFTPGNLMGEDLGGRARLIGAHALRWYPSEADVSIRPGWFYHAGEDGRVKSAAQLVGLYFSSIGRNSALLLNVPADTRGRISRADVKSLQGMRTLLDRTFRTNLLPGAEIREGNPVNDHPARLALDGEDESCWGSAIGDDSEFVVFTWPEPRSFNCAMLQEQIRLGQHVERFRVEGWNGGAWSEIARGTTIGEKRLLLFPVVSAQKVRFVIEQSRGPFMISALGLYRTPGEIAPSGAGGP